MRRAIAILLLFTVSSANAALVARAGGAAYYDNVLDITWLADANYALTDDFGVAGISGATGKMDAATADLWVDALNASNHLGINTWRLPVVNPVDGVALNVSFSEDGSTDAGRNLGTADSVYPGTTASELAHLYFTTLGNISTRDVNGDPTACFGGNCLVNTGPFSNLNNVRYWTGTDSPNAGSAMYFNFNGFQGEVLATDTSTVWVVAAGDALVPVPAAIWLFGSALGGLGWLRRQRNG